MHISHDFIATTNCPSDKTESCIAALNTGWPHGLSANLVTKEPANFVACVELCFF